MINAAVIWWRHLLETQIRTFLAWSAVSRLSHVPPSDVSLTGTHISFLILTSAPMNLMTARSFFFQPAAKKPSNLCFFFFGFSFFWTQGLLADLRIWSGLGSLLKAEYESVEGAECVSNWNSMFLLPDNLQSISTLALEWLNEMLAH